MTAPAHLNLSPMPARLAEIQAEAERRKMSPVAFVNAVVKDYLREQAARGGDGHRHCYCREENPGGLARCCWCGFLGSVALSGTRYTSIGVGSHA